MNTFSKKITISTVAAITLLTAIQSNAQLVFTGSGSDSDGSFTAQVTFTLSGDELKIVLENTTDVGSGQWAAGLLASGVSFNVNGGTGADLNSGNGNIATMFTVAHGVNTYANTGNGTILPQWQVQTSGHGTGFNVNLNLFNGEPGDMIIGNDSMGGTSGAGTYDINNSVYNHQPIVLGAGTFMVTVTNITSLSQISDVVFNFGTQPGEGTACGVPVPVPEPTTIISGALLLVPLSVQLMRKSWKRAQPKTD